MTERSDSAPLALRDVRRMFEGVVPPVMCTASPEGVPHVNYLSQAEYVDEQHVALTFQFFNHSRTNVLATRRAALAVDDPYTGAGVVMQLAYVRTDVKGPVFERLRAKLAGIASHTGMEHVFRLRGADVYRVLELRRVPGRLELPATASRRDVANGARVLSERLAGATSLAQLLDTLMGGLAELLRIEHAMLWLIEESRACLVLLASHGYEATGVGAEMPAGEGLVGVAAREGVPIRIGHMAKMAAYGRAVRGRAEEQGLGHVLSREIPLPGLPSPRSQLAVPLRLRGKVLGVLFVESQHDQFFSYDDEDALAMLCGQVAAAFALLQAAEGEAPQPPAPAQSPQTARTVPLALQGNPVRLRHFTQDDSVFLDDEYLIKGVAGAILWKLANEFVQRGRTEFTNRELRASPELRLPDVQDNLEVRLLLLERRLSERAGAMRIERAGRGRLRLCVTRPLLLLAPE